MTQILGNVPTKAELLLRKGCDFVWALTVDDDEPLPAGTVVTLYVYDLNGEELLSFWPAVEVLPGSATLQIYADDHVTIPHGAKFQVILDKPGFPKLAWLEGRVSKASR